MARAKQVQHDQKKYLLKIIKITVLGFFLATSLSATESYEVISTSLFSEKNTGGDTQNLNLKDLESIQEPFAQKQLERLPSLNITPTGPQGRTIEYTLRGAKSSQNAVFLDGVLVNNPASGGKFDFADLLVEDLEEIEVLPGANSVIYGANALGGVIHLKTKKGRGKPRGLAKGGAGNFKTQQGHIEAQGEFHNLNFYGSGTGYKSGKGDFRNKVHNNIESDYYRNSTVSSSLGMTPNDNTEIGGFVRSMDANVQFDNSQFVPLENAYLPFASDSFSHTRTTLGGIHGDLNSFDNFWEHHLILGAARTKRETTTPGFSSLTQGQNSHLKYYEDLNWASWTTSTLGFDLGHEKVQDSFSGKHDRDQHALFFQEKFKPWKSTELTSGIRYDHYSFGGRRVNYRLGASHTFGNSRLRSSFGTGFKPPVLSDMFNIGPFALPNPQLKAETNHSFDMGFDHKLNEKFEGSFTVFYNRIENIVISQRVGNQFQRVNGGRRTARGLEGTLAHKPFETLKLRTSATLTRAYDHHLQKRAPNISVLKGTLEAFWKPFQKVELFVTTLCKSSQIDAVTSKILKPFTKVNVGGKYHFYEHVSLFGRIDNITNRQYEEVFGYSVRGRLFLMGLEVRT
ncbi:TonB-dependent receptor [Candidatus Bealeia paramacronuclearis]